MSDKKTFNISFYRLHLDNDDNDGVNFQSHFDSIHTLGQQLNSKSGSFGTKMVEKTAEYFFGELKKFRDDAPFLGDRQGTERPINMNPDESVFEKCFYWYCRNSNVFAMQKTDTFQSPRQLINVINNQRPRHSPYYSHLTSNDAMNRLNKNKNNIKTFEIDIITPSEKSAGNDSWSKSVLDIAQGAPQKLQIKYSNTVAGTAKHSLSNTVVGNVKNAFNNGMLDKAKAMTMDGETIDLIEDLLRDKMSVNMLGKYPAKEDVKNEFIDIFDRRSDDLAKYVF